MRDERPYSRWRKFDIGLVEEIRDREDVRSTEWSVCRFNERKETDGTPFVMHEPRVFSLANNKVTSRVFFFSFPS